MTETATHYFIFYVLPAVFILIWGWCFFYIRRVNKKIREIAGPGRRLDSVEAGAASVTLEKERRSGKSANV